MATPWFCLGLAAATLRQQRCAGSWLASATAATGGASVTTAASGVAWTDGLDELLAAKHDSGTMSLVGWSLGGIHAIELARRRPERRAVRSSPWESPGRSAPPAGRDVPTTSVYSRTDAIVPWRSSLLRSQALHENIEVPRAVISASDTIPAVAVGHRGSSRAEARDVAMLQRSSLGPALVAGRRDTGREHR